MKIVPLINCVAFVLLAGQASWGQIKPVESRITLEVAGKSVKPDEIQANWQRYLRVGDRAFTLKQNTFNEADPKTGQVLWTVKSEYEGVLTWIGAAGDVAYLANVPSDRTSTAPAVILRCDITAKKWLAPLGAPGDKPGWDPIGTLVDAKLGSKGIAMMTVLRGADASKETYRVAFFSEGKTEAAWTQSLPLGGERPSPGVFLLSNVQPDFAHAGVSHLTWCGEDLIVCGGEKSDIVCIDPTGKTSWTLPRIWEFQRGFIGPSVWSHFLSRFGTDISHGTDEPKQPHDNATDFEKMEWQNFTAARDAFNKQFECAIIGGPIVLPQAHGNQLESAIFVAVAKGPNNRYAGYLSDCLVYEMTWKGRVVGMLNLPHSVLGSRAAATSEGLTWACQQSAFVRLVPRDVSGFGHIGMDDDCLCVMPWYRQLSAPTPTDAWLSTGAVSSVMAFSDQFAFASVSGGSVPFADHHLFRFNITCMDLRTGIDHEAVLKVPVEGEVALPAANYSSITDEKGTHVMAMGPYLLGVTLLSVQRGKIEVVIGGEGSATGLSFDLKAFATGP